MNKAEKTRMLMENFNNYLQNSTQETQMVSELTQKELYFPTYTAAINAALEYAEKSGYETDKEELADIIGLKSRRPKVGETTTVHIPLYKGGKPQKKYLHIMVYGMEKLFELTRYIN